MELSIQPLLLPQHLIFPDQSIFLHQTQLFNPFQHISFSLPNVLGFLLQYLYLSLYSSPSFNCSQFLFVMLLPVLLMTIYCILVTVFQFFYLLPFLSVFLLNLSQVLP